MNSANSLKEDLLKMAIEAREKSHSPYSHYKVGSACLTKDGKKFSGTNIENASYGATVCAERVAIWKAVSEGALMPVKEILVLTDSIDPWPPCGMCRQVMAEFCDDKSTLIHIANLQGIQKTFTLSELLPESFKPQHLHSS